MPASIMRAVTGSIASVSGRRRATAVGEPKPGRSPVTVPNSTPAKQKKTLTGENAVWNPSTTCARKSTASPLEQVSEDPRRQGYLQEHHERQPGHGYGADAEQNPTQPA